MLGNCCIILNPAAKGERARKLISRITAKLPEAELKLTHRPAHAQILARQAVEEGFATIVAAGGDGTINEVVNGIAGSDAALGVLPVGTMNVFATELGIPDNLDAALHIIRRRRTRAIDLAHANDRFFVQLAGVGFDAQIVANTDWEFKKNFGPLSYVVTAGHLLSQKPPRLHLELGSGETMEGSFVLVGNGRHYGGPFVFFPSASLCDGALDICLFKKVSYLDVFRYLHGVLTGAHTKMPDVAYFTARSLRVFSDTNVPVEVDGELHGKVPVHFSVEPRVLRVVVP